MGKREAEDLESERLEREKQDLLSFIDKHISAELKKKIDLAYRLSEIRQPQLKITSADNRQPHA